MSVVTLPDGKLDVRCDMPGGCQNHWVVVDDEKAITAAEEQLGRWGWRTVRRVHFCPRHVQRVAELEPDERVVQRRRAEALRRRAHAS